MWIRVSKRLCLLSELQSVSLRKQRPGQKSIKSETVTTNRPQWPVFLCLRGVLREIVCRIAGENLQNSAQQRALQTQAALGALRAEEGGMPETSGYRPEPQTLTISVCDEENNCTRSTVPSARSDVQPPHHHTGVVAEPLSSGSVKKR